MSQNKSNIEQLIDVLIKNARQLCTAIIANKSGHTQMVRALRVMTILNELDNVHSKNKNKQP